ncbi:MAG: response regulator [Bacteroidales bacterium]|nr:response regulator [Bacteroidales bacterium]MCF8388352.1 response regulator [Bacteroidales bacterium]MCF8399274.1 response regulator [Bacteroidales bacterium]
MEGNQINKLRKNKWEGKKILVVEDVDTSNMYFKAALGKTDAHILWASNGIEALEIAQENDDIDLVLMDIHMPGMNGFEASRELRKKNKKLKIIIQTAYVLSGEREKSMKLGCTDFITKPINYKKLIHTIEKHI